jgi:quinol monooxygenase YgiN
MAGYISYVFEVAIRDGQVENFKALMKEMIEATWANEPDTLGYEWYISADGKTCHTCERYVDSAAVVTHMKHVGEAFSARYFAAAEPVRLVVYGNPDDDVRQIFERLNPLYLPNAGGFTR